MALLSEKIRIEKGEFSGDYFVVFAVKVAKDNRLYLHEIYQKKYEKYHAVSKALDTVWGQFEV